eukprot:scaffold2382_cov108-Isochrysis_galbana.AAC.4
MEQISRQISASAPARRTPCTCAVPSMPSLISVRSAALAGGAGPANNPTTSNGQLAASSASATRTSSLPLRSMEAETDHLGGIESAAIPAWGMAAAEWRCHIAGDECTRPTRTSTAAACPWGRGATGLWGAQPPADSPSEDSWPLVTYKGCDATRTAACDACRSRRAVAVGEETLPRGGAADGAADKSAGAHKKARRPCSENRYSASPSATAPPARACARGSARAAPDPECRTPAPPARRQHTREQHPLSRARLRERRAACYPPRPDRRYSHPRPPHGRATTLAEIPPAAPGLHEPLRQRAPPRAGLQRHPGAASSAPGGRCGGGRAPPAPQAGRPAPSPPRHAPPPPPPPPPAAAPPPPLSCPRTPGAFPAVRRLHAESSPGGPGLPPPLAGVDWPSAATPRTPSASPAVPLSLPEKCPELFAPLPPPPPLDCAALPPLTPRAQRRPRDTAPQCPPMPHGFPPDGFLPYGSPPCARAELLREGPTHHGGRQRRRRRVGPPPCPAGVRPHGRLGSHPRSSCDRWMLALDSPAPRPPPPPPPVLHYVQPRLRHPPGRSHRAPRPPECPGPAACPRPAGTAATAAAGWDGCCN